MKKRKIEEVSILSVSFSRRGDAIYSDLNIEQHFHAAYNTSYELYLPRLKKKFLPVSIFTMSSHRKPIVNILFHIIGGKFSSFFHVFVL